jgi:hypothetical protein
MTTQGAAYNAKADKRSWERMNSFLKDVEIIHQNIFLKQYKFRFF